MTDEAFEKYQSVWTAVHNLVDKMLSGEAGAEDIRDKLTDEFRFWKRSGHDISATTPQPEQESFSNEAISATQAAWKMGYDAAKAEQPEEEPVAYYHPHKGFYWAKPTRISAPTAVDVKPLPLYAAPPQRKPLTDEQIAEALGFGEHTTATTRAILTHAARAIEAKIKENK